MSIENPRGMFSLSNRIDQSVGNSIINNIFGVGTETNW
jgi:hypothetical protein